MLKPSTTPLSGKQIQTGLSFVTKDGVFTEAMVAFTGGTFLVAMAMQMGASNFQIGLLASLPTLSNIFQLVSIWLVQRYNNRRAISVISSLFARFPLLVIGVLPFVFSARTSVNALIFLLFFHYFFGAISGASWNSWMKDLVPADKLGSYFSYRTRLAQIVNVVLSILTALATDYIKAKYPQYEPFAYPLMFVAGGITGMTAVYMMSRTPEPQAYLQNGHVLKMIRKPLKDVNFRKLLLFNSTWAFSLNLATPFLSVYLMKTLNIALSTIIMLNILSQLSSILFMRIWGNYSDRFSNKTVIRICAPAYILCMVGWSLVGNHMLTVPFLTFIHILSGLTTGGINLAITNIGMKLAPQEESIVYIAARNIVNAFIPALAPIFGGMLADFLVTHRMVADYSLKVPLGGNVITVFKFTNWNLFFMLSAAMAFGSLQFLKKVKEDGEVGKGHVVIEMFSTIKSRIEKRDFLWFKDKNQKRA
ncbi:MAG TPA: MFS transporter [Flavitalea sp.]|nr:MFS transporter [Flavitalea sp.]